MAVDGNTEASFMDYWAPSAPTYECQTSKKLLHARKIIIHDRVANIQIGPGDLSEL